MKPRLLIYTATTLALGAGVAGCSSTRHVPQGGYLLDNVKIEVKDTKEVGQSDLINYLRQTPNHKVLGFAKLQLGTYNLSGRDTTKWVNRTLRKLGQAPVIYDPSLTTASVTQLERALNNQGYMDAVVTYDTFPNADKRKIDVVYHVTAGKPHRINSIDYEIADAAIDSIIKSRPQLITIKPGDRFDRTDLDQMRAGITQHLQRVGYYTFTKDNISFIADTTESSKSLDLTMVVRRPRQQASQPLDSVYHKYYFGNVTIVTDFNAKNGASPHGFARLDTVRYRNIDILYGSDHYLSPKTLEECCFMVPGQRYSSADIDHTYDALGRLGILKYINIHLQPVAETDTLDVLVVLDRTKKQGVTLELEGTNSEGDLGFGVGLTYQHRNLAHGSQLLTAKVRASYESLSGNVDGLLHDRYTELATEVGITFPKFEMPLLSRHYKRRVRASTQFAVSFNYQERPEYTRIISGAAWKYIWSNRANTVRRTFDLIDVNYVYLPHSTLNFINQIAPSNPLLRYSYEDHFIMRMGYTFRRTNRRAAAIDNPWSQPSVYSLRASIETAGNLLYGLSSLFGQKRVDGAYKVFGIQYAQYVKGEFDYALTRNFDRRNAFAVRFGAGVGVPYANSSMIPFEKRFYAGGANSVRGWSARALGPGCYDAHNSASDFINQCGDISLIASAEYRTKLFWVFEGAFFVDAGNIWTIHNYENQRGGFFRFNDFYKQIAAAYGLGLRLDFSYFLLRFDLGFKAHNPAKGQEEWPIAHPRWGRDATFHFAVGYPF